MEVVSITKLIEILKYTFSRNSIYPLPSDGSLSTHINGKNDYVSRYKSFYQNDKLDWLDMKILLWHHAFLKNPRFNISAKQDLPLPNNRIAAFEPTLFSSIIPNPLLYYHAKKIIILKMMQTIVRIYYPIDN